MSDELRDSDIQLLGELAEYRVLTAKQLAYILNRNLRALQRRVESLCKVSLVELLAGRLPLNERGRPEKLYGVGRTGARRLLERGILKHMPEPDHATARPLQSQLLHQYLQNSFRLNLIDLQRRANEISVAGLSSNSPFAIDGRTSYPITRARIRSESSSTTNPTHLIPDFVYYIHSQSKNRSLLFFLEVDTGTEALCSASRSKPNVSQKVRNYQEYFRSTGYKFYESLWNTRFNGFRLLLFCADSARARKVAESVRINPPSDFIWVTSVEALAAAGLAGEIWYRGGDVNSPLKSILGSLGRPLPFSF